MVSDGHTELEHRSVSLIKQEVSRKHRETKDRTGRVIHEPRLQASAGKHPTAPEMGTQTQQVEWFMWDLCHFSYALGTLSLNKLDRNEGDRKTALAGR